MTERSLYNERLGFDQNTNVSIIESSSRSTRYRNKKRKSHESSPEFKTLETDNEISRRFELPLNEKSLCIDEDQNELINNYDLNDNSEENLDPLILEADFFATDSSGDLVEYYEEDSEESCHDQDNSKTDTGSSVTLLYEDAPLTFSASHIIIMQFKIRHNLTDQCLEDLLHILKIHCPKPNHVPNSLYHFKKFFRESRYQIKYHYFCSRCLQNIDNSDSTCANSSCGISLQEVGAKYSFIEIPIESQLEVLFARNGFYEALVQNMGKHRAQSTRGVYTDIYDGSVYQQLILDKHTDSPSNISVIFNTDGFPVFRSSGFAFWPLYLLINELPYQMRVAKENRIFAGLWYGCAKPEMTLFLEPMAQSLKKLYLEGVTLSLPSGESVICRVALICTTVDLPAKAIVSNMVQFNGYWGCCHCLQKGQRVACGEKGTTQTYPFIEKDPCGPLRNHQQTCQDAELAVKENQSIQGVKGPTWLSIIPCFDVIQGMAVDYMHCTLLGVCRLLLKLWLQSTYHKKAWYIGRKASNLDTRLCGIRPPNEIQRTPRSISTTLKYWKAHELRAWLLHYSPVVLYEILPEDFYQHHLLLVEAIYLLLQDSIKAEEVQQSSLILQHYCFMFAPLYGEEHMTANVHCLLHLPKCVETLGLLWGTSCFLFENANAQLLKLFHGSKGVEKQIVHQIITCQLLPLMAQDSLQPESYIHCVYEQMATDVHKRKRYDIDETFSLLGSSHKITLTTTEKELFMNAGYIPAPTVVSYTTFIILKTKHVLHTAQTSRSKKRHNSCISVTSGFGILQKIILLENPTPKCLLIITKLQPASCQLCEDNITNSQFNQHFKCFTPPRTSQQVVVSIKDVIAKCVYMDMEAQMGQVFISLLPNATELE